MPSRRHGALLLSCLLNLNTSATPLFQSRLVTTLKSVSNFHMIYPRSREHYVVTSSPPSLATSLITQLHLPQTERKTKASRSDEPESPQFDATSSQSIWELARIRIDDFASHFISMWCKMNRIIWCPFTFNRVPLRGKVIKTWIIS